MLFVGNRSVRTWSLCNFVMIGIVTAVGEPSMLLRLGNAGFLIKSPEALLFDILDILSESPSIGLSRSSRFSCDARNFWYSGGRSLGSSIFRAFRIV